MRSYHTFLFESKGALSVVPATAVLSAMQAIGAANNREI